MTSSVSQDPRWLTCIHGTSDKEGLTEHFQCEGRPMSRVQQCIVHLDLGFLSQASSVVAQRINSDYDSQKLFCSFRETQHDDNSRYCSLDLRHADEKGDSSPYLFFSSVTITKALNDAPKTQSPASVHTTGPDSCAGPSVLLKCLSRFVHITDHLVRNSSA